MSASQDHISQNHPSPNYRALLETSQRINWRVEDLIGGERRLDFTRPFLPESFARTRALEFLTPAERLCLNHIRAHGYLAMFGLVEEFILPFVVDQTRTLLEGADDYRTRAYLQFAAEEAKHIQLFKRFREEFEAGFGALCGFIGPARDIAQAVLAHGDLGVAIAVLGIELMSQEHYVASIKDDAVLDPQFCSLLRHHWMEEAQHAKLDALLLFSLAEGGADVTQAVDDYLDIGGFLDGGLKAQAGLDLASFEQARGRRLSDDEREAFLGVQHQALRWTFLGSAMKDGQFRAALGRLGGDAQARIDAVAPAFC